MTAPVSTMYPTGRLGSTWGILTADGTPCRVPLSRPRPVSALAAVTGAPLQYTIPGHYKNSQPVAGPSHRTGMEPSAESLAARIRRLVADAPRLSPSQADHIAYLLRGQ